MSTIFPRGWFVIIYLGFLTSGHLQATTYPRGDEEASVEVENGNFAVYFSNNQIQDRDPDASYFRIVYSPSGQLLAPRHHRSDLKRKSNDFDLTRHEEIRLGNETISFSPLTRGQPIPFFTLKKGNKTEQHRLAWSDQPNFQLQAAAGDATGICMLLWSGEEISMRYFDRRRFDFPKAVTVGKPLLMGSLFGPSPDASNLVKIRDRYCLGWLRSNEQTKKSEAVISTWKPGDERTVDSVLDEIAHWNTWMSFAAIDDHVCLAYHCRYQGDYPGFGKLITVFRKIDPVSGAAVPPN